MLVPGLEGGPDVAPNDGRARTGGLDGPSMSKAASGTPGVDDLDPASAMGGCGIDVLRGVSGVEVGGRRGTLGGPIGRAELPDALRDAGGPARGGGGVGVDELLSVAPPFLFTHFFSAGS